MQKLIKNVFLLAVGLLVFQSCNKDEEVNTNPETVVGIWSISAFDPDVSINGIDITDVPPELLGLDETGSLLLNLLLGPNSSTLFEAFQIEFKDDNTVAILSEDGMEDNASYLFTNNQLLISQEDNEEEIIFNVSNLTNNTMDLALDQTIDLDLDEDGIEENVSVVLLVSLVK